MGSTAFRDHRRDNFLRRPGGRSAGDVRLFDRAADDRGTTGGGHAKCLDRSRAGGSGYRAGGIRLSLSTGLANGAH